MKKKLKQKKNQFVQQIALERMYRLMELAEENWKTNKKRSKEYLALMKRISTRNKARIPKELREKFCKKCLSLLTPSSCTVRVVKKNLWVKCSSCNKIKKTRLPEKNLFQKKV